MSPVVKAMTRLGMLRITALMTLASAIMSEAVAVVFSLIFPITDLSEHLLLAFIIPFFVTPPFSYMTALSLRDSGRARKEAFELARRDCLTNALNRRAFFDADCRTRQNPETGSLSRTVFFLDIDHFKLINDTWGHEGGDAVLVHLAELLQGTLRKSDVVARFGGEEFVILALDCDETAARCLSDRLFETIRTTSVPYLGREIKFTVSMGVAIAGPDIAIDRLLAQADAQLYAAKVAGRDTCRILQSLDGFIPAGLFRGDAAQALSAA